MSNNTKITVLKSFKAQLLVDLDMCEMKVKPTKGTYVEIQECICAWGHYFEFKAPGMQEFVDEIEDDEFVPIEGDTLAERSTARLTREVEEINGRIAKVPAGVTVEGFRVGDVFIVDAREDCFTLQAGEFNELKAA